MSSENLQGEKALKKLKDIVNDVNIAMMCTTQKDNSIHSRPMATAGIDNDGTIWFFTNEGSEKVKEIENDNGLCLCYSEPKNNTYACVMGKAKAVDNKAKEKELWNPILKAWFPKGLEDPNMTLIKVSPNHAEYWDANDSKMVVFLKIAKAAITGKSYDAEDSHGEMKL
ncbi:pyridoxamine 5'-phosphate oxidase family protein [Owenweeksia hongkongensis]|uniref:pyridoxamine 5'-phosphate oxidase family protein n=1 Tax=Owenweeksia hongkongensis TaxID=253245 RepID=UPI003A91856C